MLNEKQSITLRDYAVIVQGEIPGFLWNTQQCTLHLVVINNKVNSLLLSHSSCFIFESEISESDVNEDVAFV